MAARLVIPSLAEVSEYSGTSLGCTDWLAIDAARIERFERATGSPDRLRGEGSPDPTGRSEQTATAPGQLLLALVPGLLPHLLVIEGWKTAVNTGAENCRFKVEVPAGSRVRMHARLQRGRSLPGGGCRVVIDVDFELEGSEQRACRASVIYLYFA